MSATIRDNMPGNDVPDDGDGPVRATFAPAHRTHVFKKLLQREFWEHKGGFFWAPVVMGAIVAVLTILGSITGSVLVGDRLGDIRHQAEWNGLEINGRTGAEAAAHALGMAGDATLISGVYMACIVLTFVVFFYALGALYDDRKDRSVLFWKSMPVSDTQMVLSKAAWALVLAPALAVAIGLVLGIVLWLISAATLAFNGFPGAGAIFTRSHPLRMLFQALSNVPVYAFWALPTVGWLMLCSAWARSKPFLWAVLIPILGGVLISWLGSLPGIEVAHDKVWYVLVVRGLLSVVPGIWYANDAVTSRAAPDIDGPEELARMFAASNSWQVFTTAELWIGAVVGAAMIYAAIRLRRWRDEG